MDADLYEKVLEGLECPICANYMAPPIRQCVTGHSICHACISKIEMCPLRKAAFSESKNITLEALSSAMKYPCLYRPLGCTLRLPLNQKEDHEAGCLFKGIKCAMSRCAWIGKADDVLEHWASKKMKSNMFHHFSVCQIKIRTESYYGNLVKAHNHLFWFKCKLSLGKIYWAVQYIGQKDIAANYYYEIEVFRSSQTKRPRITFTSDCLSVDVEDHNLFKEDVCTSMSIDCLNQFVKKDQILNYYLRVRKNYDISSEDLPSFATATECSSKQ